MMKTRLTKDGPEVSRIALGMMRLPEWDYSPARLLELVEESISLGVTTFDHADIYGSYSCERSFGEAIALSPSIRDKIQIVTKCGIVLAGSGPAGGGIKHYDTSRRHIIESVENSLRNLGTDYVDILLIHRPDPIMDPEEIGSAFSELKESGKALHFGISNFSPGQHEMMAEKLGLPVVTNQIECSVLHTGPFVDGTLDECVKRGCRPMAWSPMGGGRLFEEEAAKAARVRKALESVGVDYGVKDDDTMALAWLLRHPAGIIPVIGTGKIERVRNAIKAVDIEIGREDWFRIWTASTGADVP